MHGGGLTHGVSLVPFAYVTLVEKGEERSALVAETKNQRRKVGTRVKALFYLLQIMLVYQSIRNRQFPSNTSIFADIYTGNRL
mgnify:CR=1 FL=1